MCTYIDGTLVAFTGEIPAHLNVGKPEIVVAPKKKRPRRSKKAKKVAISVGMIDWDHKPMQTGIPKYHHYGKKTRPEYLGERSGRIMTHRTCDRNPIGIPVYKERDSHGFHGRQIYKDRNLRSAGSGKTRAIEISH
ncbi:MAG: hypothetical protein RI935_637 [Candidatus Parcubacteria bacterium]|jgi:hypothetical protein